MMSAGWMTFACCRCQPRGRSRIVSQGGDVAGEGYILTTDDRMFWDRVYASMASGQDEQEEE